eukprot:g5930.t1
MGMGSALHVMLVLAGGTTAATPARRPPNLIFLLADDLGWADVGFHRPPGYAEVKTPFIDSLVAQGRELDRHYVHKYCSPSRSSFQSGRMPIHVNVNNFLPTNVNPADPVSGFSAIPRNMTGIATRLREANYTTIMAGKWDCGMATHDHTPQGRGYQHSLFYFHHDNDFWTSRAGPGCPEPNTTGHGWHAYTKKAAAPGGWLARDGYLAAGNDALPKADTSLAGAQAACGALPACAGFTFEAYDRAPAGNISGVSFKTSASGFVPDTGVMPQDLWQDGNPAHAVANNATRCGGSPWPAADENGTLGVCAYEDDVFARFVLERAKEHLDGAGAGAGAGAGGLFVFWAFHIAHSPYQVPKNYEDMFGFIDNDARRTYHAMVHYMDDKIGELVALLKRYEGEWENTLLVFSSE